MPTLKRTQMYFPEDVLRELKRKAREEKTTVAEIVRSSVSEKLRKEKAKDWTEDPLWNMVGSSSSKDRDLSVNHDKYLYGKNK
jgi:post-segregation antitoxin (ccd killing protein)